MGRCCFDGVDLIGLKRQLEVEEGRAEGLQANCLAVMY